MASRVRVVKTTSPGSPSGHRPPRLSGRRSRRAGRPRADGIRSAPSNRLRPEPHLRAPVVVVYLATPRVLQDLGDRPGDIVGAEEHAPGSHSAGASQLRAQPGELQHLYRDAYQCGRSLAFHAPGARMPGPAPVRARCPPHPCARALPSAGCPRRREDSRAAGSTPCRPGQPGWTSPRERSPESVLGRSSVKKTRFGGPVVPDVGRVTILLTSSGRTQRKSFGAALRSSGVEKGRSASSSNDRSSGRPAPRAPR